MGWLLILELVGLSGVVFNMKLYAEEKEEVHRSVWCAVVSYSSTGRFFYAHVRVNFRIEFFQAVAARGRIVPEHVHSSFYWCDLLVNLRRHPFVD